ncbi:hypothetical protein LbFV_ORF59 [Leptopilina boulardi filamentous virus]|uniref:Uncharacterized protein n=1 Tax=Leptopilina boulardi filamentous virus TaxID=552509 RepID=A0A1S5YD06_9VIRU|nr:hypothetical protein LbFV_ORF59 [Leptopilina boulardi filamentous virus]AQQ79979.1 hypothetical protein LbFV_ORF59 [Leptopilina boulardi filamentous virus]
MSSKKLIFDLNASILKFKNKQIHLFGLLKEDLIKGILWSFPLGIFTIDMETYFMFLSQMNCKDNNNTVKHLFKITPIEYKTTQNKNMFLLRNLFGKKRKHIEPMDTSEYVEEVPSCNKIIKKTINVNRNSVINQEPSTSKTKPIWEYLKQKFNMNQKDLSTSEESLKDDKLYEKLKRIVQHLQAINTYQNDPEQEMIITHYDMMTNMRETLALYDK